MEKVFSFFLLSAVVGSALSLSAMSVGAVAMISPASYNKGAEAGGVSYCCTSARVSTI
jgi:hypothetical protein